jgi:hypothetical protein
MTTDPASMEDVLWWHELPPEDKCRVLRLAIADLLVPTPHDPVVVATLANDYRASREEEAPC